LFPGVLIHLPEKNTVSITRRTLLLNAASKYWEMLLDIVSSPNTVFVSNYSSIQALISREHLQRVFGEHVTNSKLRNGEKAFSTAVWVLVLR
jgi:hypothetical protein